MPANVPASDTIEFPAQRSPLAIFFVVVPVLTIVTIAIVVLNHKLPIYLMCLLGVVAIGCLALAKAALETIGDVTLELTGEELVVKRLLGSASYSWSHIESVKKFDPGPTFADTRSEEGSAGIGLFLRDPERKKEREADAPPDVLIVSRNAEEADKVAKACERIANARRKAMGGAGDQRRGAVGGKSTRAFRKPAVAA